MAQVIELINGGVKISIKSLESDSSLQYFTKECGLSSALQHWLGYKCFKT